MRSIVQGRLWRPLLPNEPTHFAFAQRGVSRAAQDLVAQCLIRVTRRFAKIVRYTSNDKGESPSASGPQSHGDSVRL